MARIRSVHPGLFTDEAFVSCSAEARIFLIGLWTECDDQGLFEWKPLTLKMRVAPADNIDAEDLLQELAAHNVVKQFEHGGRKYGAVRNFRKFQRPKKPNATHFMPRELRTYVGLEVDSSEEVPHQFPTEPEKSPQMEDVGCRGEDEGETVSDETVQRDAGAKKQTFRQAMETGDLKPECFAKTQRLFSEKGWPQIDLELLWEEFVPYWRDERPRTKKADWPQTFYNRAVERRTWSAYRAEGAKTNGQADKTDSSGSAERIARVVARQERSVAESLADPGGNADAVLPAVSGRR